MITIKISTDDCKIIIKNLVKVGIVDNDNLTAEQIKDIVQAINNDLTK